SEFAGPKEIAGDIIPADVRIDAGRIRSARQAPTRMARDEDPRPAGRDGVAIVETCGSKLAVPQEATIEVVFPKQRIIVVCGHRSQGPSHHVDTGPIDSDGAAVILPGGPELTHPQNLGAGLTTRAWGGGERRCYRKRRQECPDNRPQIVLQSGIGTITFSLDGRSHGTISTRSPRACGGKPRSHRTRTAPFEPWRATTRPRNRLPSFRSHTTRAPLTFSRSIVPSG